MAERTYGSKMLATSSGGMPDSVIPDADAGEELVLRSAEAKLGTAVANSVGKKVADDLSQAEGVGHHRMLGFEQELRRGSGGT